MKDVAGQGGYEICTLGGVGRTCAKQAGSNGHVVVVWDVGTSWYRSGGDPETVAREFVHSLEEIVAGGVRVEVVMVALENEFVKSATPKDFVKAVRKQKALATQGVNAEFTALQRIMTEAKAWSLLTRLRAGLASCASILIFDGVDADSSTVDQLRPDAPQDVLGRLRAQQVERNSGNLCAGEGEQRATTAAAQMQGLEPGDWGTCGPLGATLGISGDGDMVWLGTISAVNLASAHRKGQLVAMPQIKDHTLTGLYHLYDMRAVATNLMRRLCPPEVDPRLYELRRFAGNLSSWVFAGMGCDFCAMGAFAHEGRILGLGLMDLTDTIARMTLLYAEGGDRSQEQIPELYPSSTPLSATGMRVPPVVAEMLEDASARLLAGQSRNCRRDRRNSATRLAHEPEQVIARLSWAAGSFGYAFASCSLSIERPPPGPIELLGAIDSQQTEVDEHLLTFQQTKQMKLSARAQLIRTEEQLVKTQGPLPRCISFSSQALYDVRAMVEGVYVHYQFPTREQAYAKVRARTRCAACAHQPLSAQTLRCTILCAWCRRRLSLCARSWKS